MINEKKDYSWMLGQQGRVLDDPLLDRAPNWIRREINAWFDMARELIIAFHCEWRVNYKELYVTSDQIPDGDWCLVEPGRHFWKGTDIPFWDGGQNGS
jgi:hypothetical protein